MEDAGGNPRAKDKGIKIATPLAGPNPGSAPKTVPRMHPMIAKPILLKLRATTNPSAKCENTSILKS